LLIIFAVTLSHAACSLSGPQQQPTLIPVAGYRVVHVYPHDPHAFTEGLAYDGTVLYESTGLQGKSDIRMVRLETGEVLRRERLEDQYFGEGLTIWQDRIIQLTYQSETGFLYDRRTLERKGSFTYRGEGWGLTTDGRRLIASDGSAVVRFLDPVSLKETARLAVRAGTAAVANLNELEFVRGEILPNIWQTRMIARIDPRTGQIRGWIDLTGIIDDHDVGVMNGIAYDAATDRLFVTGKFWPKLFQIEIDPMRGSSPDGYEKSKASSSDTPKAVNQNLQVASGPDR
jgi:glutamine cyclotransferase